MFEPLSHSPAFSSKLQEAFCRLRAGLALGEKLSHDALLELLSFENGSIRDTQLGAFLFSISCREPSSREIAGLARAALTLDSVRLSQKKQILLPPDKRLLGLSGSGKKASKTFNVTTSAALLACAMGAYVAKCGSRSTSSLAGSSDILESLGLNVNMKLEDAINLTKETGFGFYSIENTIPKFDKVYGGRFLVTHALSYVLPALLLPVRVDSHIYGLSQQGASLSMESFKRLGVENVSVVSSTADQIRFIDEVSVAGKVYLEGEAVTLGMPREFVLSEVLDLPDYQIRDVLPGETASENTELFKNLLKGKIKGAKADMLCANTALMLVLSRLFDSFTNAFDAARSAYRAGAAYDKLCSIIALTR